MRAYQRFSKAYSLFCNGKKIGEYTTVDGAYAAAKRKGLEEFEVRPNY
jgi:hypothetical protein